MFYGSGLFLSSDNEKIQPHKKLPAGPRGSVWCVCARAGVCMGMCDAADTLGCLYHLPVVFLCFLPFQRGIYCVNSTVNSFWISCVIQRNCLFHPGLAGKLAKHPSTRTSLYCMCDGKPPEFLYSSASGMLKKLSSISELRTWCFSCSLWCLRDPMAHLICKKTYPA